MAFNIPITIGPEGLQPTAPATLQQQLIAEVAADSPGYTANLPASMIEDMSSTAVGALTVCDSAKVETVNSLNPNAANVPLLVQLGSMLGVKLGTPTNTSVPVVFSGTVGYVIPNGELVGDGTNTYQVQVGGVIGTGGSSGSLLAIAIKPGSFSVAANTVTQVLSSIPSGVTLTVNNPSAGTPGSAQETYASYRSRVLQANLAASVGTPRYIKTLISLVSGVPANYISVQQAAGLRVVVGGSGDPYQVANAIFMGVGDPSVLVGSAISSGRNVTVSLLDYPDTYSILSVGAVSQTVALSVTWNTILSSFTSGAAFPGLVQQPLADYINGIAIGNPINILEMQAIFQQAVSGLLPATQLTRLVFGVTINGSPVTPGSGQSYVSGDAEGYFTCATSAITVSQG